MATSALGSTLDTIRAALILRAGLSGVNVFTGPVSDEEAGTESIEFGDAEMDEDAFAMGAVRQEIWNVEGTVTAIVKPWQGGTELTIEAARDRALAIFAELETHLNDTYVGSYPDVGLTSAKLEHWLSTEGRMCVIPFTMQIQGQKNP